MLLLNSKEERKYIEMFFSDIFRHKNRETFLLLLVSFFTFYFFFLNVIHKYESQVRQSGDTFARLSQDHTVYVLSDSIPRFNPRDDILYSIDLEQKTHLTIKEKNFDNKTLTEKLQRWNYEFNYRISKSHKPVRLELLRLARLYSDENGVIVDSGAHIGDTSLPFFEEIRYTYKRTDLHLVLVEPEYSKCLWIHKYIEFLSRKHGDDDLMNHIHIVNSGIWSYHTHASLIKKNHPGSWYVQTDVYRLRQEAKKRKFKMENFVDGDIVLNSIDSILHEKAKFSLWHLDAKNSETRALLGLMRTSHRPLIIMESMSTTGTDFLLNNDILCKNMDYKLIKRVKPNFDRVFLPAEIFDDKLENELPFFT